MSATMNDLEPRVAVLEEIARSIKGTQERIERRLDAINTRLIALQSDQRSDFRWLLGAGLAAFGAMFGLLAHAQHWL